MKWLLLFALALTFSARGLSQEDEELYGAEISDAEENEGPSNEIGFDVNLSASTLGGTGGLGLKIGFPLSEHLIAGPGLRYQSTWSKNQGINYSFSSYGGGVFLHYRLLKYLFAGTEIELLSTPWQQGYLTGSRKWVPIALVGGGFSHELNSSIRLNAGIMYDLINNFDSPLRQGYFVRNSNNVLLPFVYRIAFLFRCRIF
jgi:outer membrane protein assembly factor BamA